MLESTQFDDIVNIEGNSGYKTMNPSSKRPQTAKKSKMSTKLATPVVKSKTPMKKQSVAKKISYYNNVNTNDDQD